MSRICRLGYCNLFGVRFRTGIGASFQFSLLGLFTAFVPINDPGEDCAHGKGGEKESAMQRHDAI